MDCCLLHGQQPLAAQAEAIAPPGTPAGKVVLATSVAESSLTIEGVTLVVDSGLSRLSRFDPATGMDGLVTQPASQASAEQRRGRAGRLGPGHCLRLWSPAEQQRRPAFDPPELLEVDPLPIALQLAEWGSGNGRGSALDPAAPRRSLEEARTPAPAAGRPRWAAAGSATTAGPWPAWGSIPAWPTCFCAPRNGAGHGLGCAVAVLLSERDPLDRREAGSDLMRRLDWLRRRRAGPWRRLQAQLLRQLRGGAASPPAQRRVAGDAAGDAGDGVVAQLLCWAYPERLALARGRGDGRFLMRCGRGAVLPPGDPLVGAEALAIASVDGQGQEARVRLAVALSRRGLEALVADAVEECSEARWDSTDQRVRCERLRKVGALVLERRPWPEAAGEQVERALLEGLQRLGLEAVLPWSRSSRQLQQRLMLAHRHLGDPWPDRSPERLRLEPGSWLGPHLGGLRSLQDLQQLDMGEILWGDLDWSLRRELDRLLPLTLPVPSGRRVPLDYGDGTPVLAVKLQEMFGCEEGPAVLDGRLPVRVELLSPAGRPAAITCDLAGFWRQGYAEVRRELRGRYPRHPWPEDPLQARRQCPHEGRPGTGEFSGAADPGPDRRPTGSGHGLQQMAESEVAQPLEDAVAAVGSGVVGAAQPRQGLHQARLGVSHHHALQAGLEHGQIIEGVPGRDHQGRLQLEPLQQGQQGGALVDARRQDVEIPVTRNETVDPVGLKGGQPADVEGDGDRCCRPGDVRH